MTGSLAPAVHVDDLTLKYEKGKTEHEIIRDFTCRFSAGSIHAVMGANGCGKSTLLQTMIGAIRPTSGSVTLLTEEPVTRRHVREWIPQDYRKAAIEHRYVRWNLQPWTEGEPESKAEPAQVEQVVRLLRLHLLLDRYPSELSGGQVQRVMLGRSILSNPDFMVLDEPFSALDATMKLEILPFLRREWKARASTIVLALHESDFAAALADHVWFFSGPPLLNAGTIVRPADESVETMVEFEDKIRSSLKTVIDKYNYV